MFKNMNMNKDKKLKKVCAINSFDAWFYELFCIFNVDAHLLL